MHDCCHNVKRVIRNEPKNQRICVYDSSVEQDFNVYRDDIVKFVLQGDILRKTIDP